MENVEPKISLSSYLAGFMISLLLTLLGFAVVYQNLLTGSSLVTTLLGLAVLQAGVQIVFFMHLGTKNRWNLAMFISTAGLVFIIVGGSMWIMYHLNYNMSPDQMNTQNMKMEGMIHK